MPTHNGRPVLAPPPCRVRTARPKGRNRQDKQIAADLELNRIDVLAGLEPAADGVRQKLHMSRSCVDDRSNQALAATAPSCQHMVPGKIDAAFRRVLELRPIGLCIGMGGKIRRMHGACVGRPRPEILEPGRGFRRPGRAKAEGCREHDEDNAEKSD
ncbi:MAG TPA: hypothetical protein VMW57_10060 [Methyloceanibacter sp.]|nr:hypothetical protein [Methyloceanibacter sp.]